MNNLDTVMLSRAEEYDAGKIKDILAVHFAALGVNAEFFAGKKVAIKPNLVMKKEPEAAATTHPVVLDALLSPCGYGRYAYHSGKPRRALHRGKNGKHL